MKKDLEAGPSRLVHSILSRNTAEERHTMWAIREGKIKERKPSRSPSRRKHKRRRDPEEDVNIFHDLREEEAKKKAHLGTHVHRVGRFDYWRPDKYFEQQRLANNPYNPRPVETLMKAPPKAPFNMGTESVSSSSSGTTASTSSRPVSKKGADAISITSLSPARKGASPLVKLSIRRRAATPSSSSSSANSCSSTSTASSSSTSSEKEGTISISSGGGNPKRLEEKAAKEAKKKAAKEKKNARKEKKERRRRRRERREEKKEKRRRTAELLKQWAKLTDQQRIDHSLQKEVEARRKEMAEKRKVKRRGKKLPDGTFEDDEVLGNIRKVRKRCPKCTRPCKLDGKCPKKCRQF